MKTIIILLLLVLLVLNVVGLTDKKESYSQKLGEECSKIDPTTSCGLNAHCTGGAWYDTTGTCQCKSDGAFDDGYGTHCVYSCGPGCITGTKPR